MRYVQEVENLLLHGGELRLEYLDDLVVVHQAVALDTAEDLEDARGARGSAVPELGVELDAGEPLGLHRGTDLSLEDRLGDHGEEVAGEQGLDAVRGLPEHRGPRLGTFEHVVTPLEIGL